MENGEESLTANNNNVDKTSLVFCVICSTEMRNETWETHANNPSHIAALDKCELVFEKEQKVPDKFCDEILSREPLEDHVTIRRVIPWDRVNDEYDKYEIFFKNLILEWKNLFHCCLCESTYEEWSTVLVHITDIEHQSLRKKIVQERAGMLEIFENDLSYELLVKEGLLGRRKSSLECRFCKSQSVNIENAHRHVKGLAHICNRSKFVPRANVETRIRTIESKKTEKHLADESLNEHTKKSTRIYRSKVEEIPTKIQANVTCDYIVKKNHWNIYCLICDCELHIDEKDRHIASEDHKNALKRHGCDDISMKNTKEYYCKICDCTISCVWNVYEHIKEQNHSTAMNTSKQSFQDAIVESDNFENIDDFWIVPIDNNFSRCSICNCSFSNLSLQMRIHVEGRFHENSRKMYGCDKVTTQKRGIHYCVCCNCEIKNPEDARLHVKTLDHLKLLKQSKQRVTEAEKLRSKKFMAKEEHLNSSEIPSTEKSSEKNANSADSLDLLEKLNLGKPNDGLSVSKKIHRTLDKTNSKTLTDDTSIIEDIERLKKNYIVQLSDASFRCLLCDCRVSPSFGKLDEHIEGILHKEAIIAYRCDRISPNENDDTNHGKLCNVDCDDLEAASHHAKEKNHINDPLVSNNSPNADIESPQSCNAEQIDYYITVNRDTKSSYCHICECALSPSDSNISRHTSGKLHVKSLRKYGCEKITLQKNQTYYCKYCNSVVADLEKVYRHIKTSSHLNFVTAGKIQQSETDKTPVKFKLMEETRTSESTEILSSTKSNVSPNTGLDYMKNHDTHRTQNSILARNYDFDEIIILEDNKYFCKCCNCMICGYEAVDLHSRGKKHLSARFIHLRNFALVHGETQ